MRTKDTRARNEGTSSTPAQCPLFRGMRKEHCVNCKLDPEDIADRLGIADTREANRLIDQCIGYLGDRISGFNVGKTTKEEVLAFIDGLRKLNKVFGTLKEVSMNNRDAIRKVMGTISLSEDDFESKGVEEILKQVERYSELDMKEEASALFDIAKEKMDPGEFREMYVEISLQLGDLYFHLEEYKDAVKWYGVGISMDDRNKELWNNRGVALARLGKLDTAVKSYNQALRIDPEYGRAWFNKGKAMHKMMKEEEALACFEKATMYDPRNISAWNNFGVLLRYFNRHKEAITCYDAALSIRNNYEWAWHNKGVALVELDKKEEAIACFDKALEINPSYRPAKRSKVLLVRDMVGAGEGKEKGRKSAKGAKKKKKGKKRKKERKSKKK